MNWRLGSTLVLLALLATTALSTMVFADTVLPPYSYAVGSKDGRFLFVMIAPVEAQEDGSYLDEESRKVAQALRQR